MLLLFTFILYSIYGDCQWMRSLVKLNRNAVHYSASSAPPPRKKNISIVTSCFICPKFCGLSPLTKMSSRRNVTLNTKKVKGHSGHDSKQNSLTTTAQWDGHKVKATKVKTGGGQMRYVTSDSEFLPRPAWLAWFGAIHPLQKRPRGIWPIHLQFGVTDALM